MAQIARFEEDCARCIGDINPGDSVEYDSSEGGWIHADPAVCEDVLDALADEDLPEE